MNRGMLAFGLGVAVAAAACGDQEDDHRAVDAAAALDAAGPDADETGALIVSGSGLTDAVGLTVVVTISDMPFTSEFGRVCEPVTVSPMAFRAIVRVPGATAGCALGAPAVFPAGPYSLIAMAMDAGGTPQQCAFLHFTMPGPTELTVPPFYDCPTI